MGSMAKKCNPTAGIYLIPLAGLGIRHAVRMRPRDILSKNLKTLMAAEPRLDTLKKIVEASRGLLSNGKLDRVRRAASATDIDTMEELAEVFGVQPWQLLVETLAVENGALAGLPSWPFVLIDQGRYETLTDTQKGYVQTRMLQAIEECEAHAKTKKVLHGLGATREPVTNAKVEQHYPMPPSFNTNPVVRKAAAKAKKKSA
jgi:hypothetical protein